MNYSNELKESILRRLLPPNSESISKVARFIVLDYGTTDEKIFHCGASSKDAGIKLMTAISEMTDPDFIASFDAVIQRYLGNPALVLR